MGKYHLKNDDIEFNQGETFNRR